MPPEGFGAAKPASPYISWMDATPEQRVMIRAQQQANQRGYRRGARFPRFAQADQGYLDPGMIAYSPPQYKYPSEDFGPANYVGPYTGEIQVGVGRRRIGTAF
jgi:hypothetical protein